MPVEQEAARFLRALRARRSQVAWARRLGYRGNPITNWERGQRFPTVGEALRAVSLAGGDVVAAFATFSPTAPLDRSGAEFRVADWLERFGAARRSASWHYAQGVRAFRSAAGCGERQSRGFRTSFAWWTLSRGACPEWVAAFVPIEAVPSLVPRHTRAVAAKRVAFEAPWSEGILRLLETEQLRRLPRHDPQLVAQHCGIELQEAQRCLALLTESGIVARVRGKYRVIGADLVDTQGGRAALHRLKARWAEVAAARLRNTPAARTCSRTT